MPEINKARSVYDTVLKALDRMNWKYEMEESELAITTGAKGSDLPIDILIRVLPESEVVSLHVPFTYDVPDEHSIDVAIALSIANYGLIRGCFDYDITTGDIRFRIAAPFNGDTVLSEDVIEMLILMAATTVDTYQTKLLMVAKGVVTPSQFLRAETEENERYEREHEENAVDEAPVVNESPAPVVTEAPAVPADSAPIAPISAAPVEPVAATPAESAPAVPENA